MKTIFRTALAAMAVAFCLVSCNKTEDTFLQRDTDKIDVDCTAQSATHYILCKGAWSLQSDVDWITFDPAEGVGDGVKYQSYNALISYNKGAAREGTYRVVHGSTQAEVLVRQAACNFAYGAVTFSGKLTQNEASTAYVSVAYTNASGEESASYSGTVTGEGSAGLSIVSGTFDGFVNGSGSVIIPISGTPTATGAISIEVSIDGRSMGTVEGTVSKAASSGGGTPVNATVAFWQFSADGSSSPTKDELAAKYPSWTGSYSITDENGAELKVVEAAGKTATAINGAAFSNGHLYLKGMYLDDAFVITRKDINLPAGAKVSFKGSMGGSGSSAGYFIAEYSVDGNTWTAAPDAKTETVLETPLTYHVHPIDNVDSVEQGAFEVSFTTTAEAKDLYVRLRVNGNVRLNNTATITTGGGGSTRFKGELSINAEYTSGGSVSGPAEGVDVGWNMYAMGYTGTEPQGSKYDYSWSFGQAGNDNASLHPVGSAQPSTSHKVLSTSGNSDAYMTCVGEGVSAYVFNPSIQAKGLMEGDYWMMVIPVRNVAKGTRVSVEMACGGAGGSVGYYMLEYSMDGGSTWETAPDAKDCTRGDDTFKAHLWNTAGSIAGTRKVYDKATEDTYQKYTFDLNGSDIAVGDLCFRLRVLKYRATTGSTLTVSAGWTDIKGFEVTLEK